MEVLIVIIFVLGYLAIAFEQAIRLNKAASALLTGVLCWAVFIVINGNAEFVSSELAHHLGRIAEILFFLMGAMTIVELMDAHDSFEVITSQIRTSHKITLLWLISFIAFFLSAVLDNLTTSIVMVSLIRKLIADKNDRWVFAGMIVIAANAGGAWSPIGDVTTTMLWIGGQVTGWNIAIKLILPGLLCMWIPLLILSFILKGKVESPGKVAGTVKLIPSTPFERKTVFYSGVGVFLSVPFFRYYTHLPPFMGILLGLGILWILTEIIHHEKGEEEKGDFSVVQALRKIDTPGILFFLGILLSISALESAHILTHLAHTLNEKINNESVTCILIGLFSAVVDNVPIVAAAQGMYPLELHPADSYLWEFIAYCAGTGGSIFIIGSAAGVAVMGMEKINFFWYLKRTGWLAALGYFAGAFAYVIMG